MLRGVEAFRQAARLVQLGRYPDWQAAKLRAAGEAFHDAAERALPADQETRFGSALGSVLTAVAREAPVEEIGQAWERLSGVERQPDDLRRIYAEAARASEQFAAARPEASRLFRGMADAIRAMPGMRSAADEIDTANWRRLSSSRNAVGGTHLPSIAAWAAPASEGPAREGQPSRQHKGGVIT